MGTVSWELVTVGIHRRPPWQAEHERLVRHLAKSSATWAPTAGLLIANLSHRLVEDTDWDYSEFSASWPARQRTHREVASPGAARVSRRCRCGCPRRGR